MLLSGTDTYFNQLILFIVVLLFVPNSIEGRNDAPTMANTRRVEGFREFLGLQVLVGYRYRALELEKSFWSLPKTAREIQV
jgi:hypothetical protein